MLNLHWLMWLLWWLRTVFLTPRVREVVGRARGLSGDARVKFVSGELYPAVRAAAYVAWYGQVLTNWVETVERGFSPDYVPSMKGVSPRTVERLVREGVNGNVDEATMAIVRGLSGVVADVARDVTARQALADVGEVSGAVEYAAQNGHPLERFHVMIRDKTSQVGGVFDDSEDLFYLVDQMTGAWLDKVDDVVADTGVLGVESRRVEHDKKSRERDSGLAADLAKIQADRDYEVMMKAHEQAVLARSWVAYASVDESGAVLTEGQIRALRAKSWENQAKFERMLHEGRISRSDYEKLVSEDEAQLRALVGRLSSLGNSRHGQSTVTEKKVAGKSERSGRARLQPVLGSYAVGYARVAVGAYTCPFCLALCSRGPVYRSNTVLGTPKRAKRGLDIFIGAYGQEAYHTGCDCVMTPVFKNEDYPGKEYADGANTLWSAYSKATASGKSRDLYRDNGRVSMNGFSRWLHSDQGRSRANELLPPGVEVDPTANEFDLNLAEYIRKRKRGTKAA
ncbi:VG15 protein [Trueperella pyogenes]